MSPFCTGQTVLIINKTSEKSLTICRLNLNISMLASDSFNNLCTSYCMVCAYVREDNTRALASGLSPVHTHNHTITASLHFVHCEIFDVEHWNVTQRCNKICLQ